MLFHHWYLFIETFLPFFALRSDFIDLVEVCLDAEVVFDLVENGGEVEVVEGAGDVNEHTCRQNIHFLVGFI